DDAAPTPVLQQPFHHLEEQEGCFSRPRTLREVGLDTGFLIPPEGRIGKDHINSVGLADCRYGCRKSVPSDDVRLAELVEQEVHHGQKVWEWLLLDAS